MSDEELLSYKKVGPEIAARYLQGGYNAHELRLDARDGICPFMRAIRGKGRYSYRVNVGKLILFKHGDLDEYY
ncbi:MAG: hypothetical protein IJZ56_03250 [Oscillospiraceae bacterium]|nr:hypothetical protein [Oscillospiraceae bacterium]